MSGIPAIHAHMANQHAAACRRRRTAAPFVFTGTSYLSSDGSAGAYAEAATNAPARLFLPGSALGTATGVCWIRRTGIVANMTIMEADASAGSAAVNARLLLSGETYTARAPDTAGVALSSTMIGVAAPLDGSAWVLCAMAVTTDTSDRVRAHFNDTTDDETADASPDAYGTGETFRIAANAAAAERFIGDIRSPAVFARYLSADEFAALYALGPTHDLREASGDYLGDVAHWWPADGDSGTTVTDRGDVGGCNLTLSGNCTIGVV